MIRFTSWLSDAERDGLRAMAREQGTSENSLMRVGLRMLLGLEVPPWAKTLTNQTDKTEENAR